MASDIEQVENDILMQFVDGGSAVPHSVLYCLFFNLHIRVINEQILFLVKLRVILQYTIQNLYFTFVHVSAFFLSSL